MILSEGKRVRVSNVGLMETAQIDEADDAVPHLKSNAVVVKISSADDIQPPSWPKGSALLIELTTDLGRRIVTIMSMSA